MGEAELAALPRLRRARLSVVPEARIAAGFAGVRAMHDVTEGGLATAARRAGRRLRRQACCRPRRRSPSTPRPSRLCALLGRRPARPDRLGQPADLLRAGRGRRPARRVCATRASRPRTSAWSGRPGAGIDARAAAARSPGRRSPSTRRRACSPAPEPLAGRRERLERRQLPVDVELVAGRARPLAQLRDGRLRRHRHDELHLEERRPGDRRLVQRRLGALDVDARARAGRGRRTARGRGGPSPRSSAGRGSAGPRAGAPPLSACDELGVDRLAVRS